MSSKLNALRDALDAAYPIPDSPHESVKQRARENRTAFIQGWQTLAASTAVQAPVREVPGWQPIETAPKDGNRILGFTPFGVEPVKWKADDGEARGFMDGWIGCEQDSTCLPGYRPGRPNAQHQPTHWMPLPSPPVQEPKP